MLAIIFLAVLSAARAVRLEKRATTDAVCAAGSCSVGQSGVAAGIILSLSSNSTLNETLHSIALLPGTYSPGTPINGTNETLAAFLGVTGTPTAQSGFEFLSPTVSFDKTALAVLYSEALCFGEGTQISQNISQGISAKSLLLAPNVTADVQVGNQHFVSLYDGVPDISRLPLSGAMKLLALEGSRCPSPCSVGGSCATNGTCVCAPGFTGATCSDCLQGFFGPTCQPCSCDASKCSSGLTGSGHCPLPSITDASACNCVNGLCTSNSTCSCSAGWTDQVGGKKCSIAAQGFAIQANGQVASCAPGCQNCTANACTSCQDGLTVDTSNAQLCTAPNFIPANSTLSTFSSCPDGQFNLNGQCAACDAACATCFGIGNARCLRCAGGKTLLQGQCVSVDLSTGVCDKSGSVLSVTLGENAVFAVDNARNICDPIPANCTAASIPAFSSSASFASLNCTACLPGTALSNGRCLSTCPLGSFAFVSNTTNTTAVCTACDAACATCSGTTSKSCLTCTAGSLLMADGSCLKASVCPTGSVASSGVCLPCAGECESCTDSPTKCATCPASRPALVGGRCLTRCPKGQFLSGNTCQTCAVSCASCSGGSDKECLSCDATHTLVAGSCVAANCAGNGTTIPGFGVCLEALLTLQPPAAQPTASSSNAGAIAGGTVGGVSLLALLLALLRKMQIKKRTQQTRQFGREKGLEEFGTVMKTVWKAKQKLSSGDKSEPPKEASKHRGAAISGPMEANKPGETERPAVYQLQRLQPARPPTPVDTPSKLTNPFLQSRFREELPRPTSEFTINGEHSPRSPSYPPR